MRRVLMFLAGVLCFQVVAFAQRPILLVTPGGVFQSEVGADGKPGPWVPMQIDVVVQGFGGGGGTVPVPPGDAPPADDADVVQVSAISKDVLKDKAEATAVAAIVEALMKAGLKTRVVDAEGVVSYPLTDALVLSAPLADTSLKASGRLVSWVKRATSITKDPAKLTAGLRLAFGITPTTLKVIAGEVGGSVLSADSVNYAVEEAFDIAAIIRIITMILDLLTKLGLI